MYPRGDNVYVLANPHNFQSMFKPGQLHRAIVLDSAALLVSIKQGLAIVLDSAALLVSIKQGLAMDPIAQVHLRHLRAHQPHPDSKDNPW